MTCIKKLSGNPSCKLYFCRQLKRFCLLFRTKKKQTKWFAATSSDYTTEGKHSQENYLLVFFLRAEGNHFGNIKFKIVWTTFFSFFSFSYLLCIVIRFSIAPNFQRRCARAGSQLKGESKRASAYVLWLKKTKQSRDRASLLSSNKLLSLPSNVLTSNINII